MILEQLEKKPHIHFGFNKQEKTILKGGSVTIWQDNIYSDNKLNVTGITKINENEFLFTGSSVGVFNVKVELPVNGKTIESNTIKINVI